MSDNALRWIIAGFVFGPPVVLWAAMVLGSLTARGHRCPR
jgi:hypothetical protein